MIRGLFLEDLSLWSCIWQSTLFAVIGLVGSLLLRSRPARASQVLFLAMIAAVLVPAMSVTVKHLELGWFVEEDTAPRPPSLGQMPSVTYVSPVEPSSANVGVEAVETAPLEITASRIEIPWRIILLCAWLTATLVLLGRLSVSIVKGILLLRRAKCEAVEDIQHAADSARARLGIDEGLTVKSSTGLCSPVIWCWSPTPILVVPSGTGHTIDWVGVISHELAHWRRWDHVTGLIAELVVCILPWNPLLWLMKKRMVRLSEQACDDWVVACGEPCEDYAQSLLSFKPQRQGAFVPAVVHSRRGLTNRVHRILTNTYANPRAGRGWLLAASTLALLTAVCVAFARTRSVESEGAPYEHNEGSDIFEAAVEGYVNTIKALLDQGVDINAKGNDNRNRTALHHAVRHGHTEVARLLIARGADVNAKDRTGDTPLHTAISKHHIEIAKLLVLNGADVNAKCESGSTPVSRALMGEEGGRSMVEFLVSRGAKVSPMHLAAYRGDIDRVRRSLEEGTNVDLRDKAGHTPLSYAASAGHMSVVELLLSEGAEVDAKDHRHRITPLCYAANSGWRNLTELLIAKSADVNAKVRWGQTLFCYPLRKGHREMVELLIDKGADVNPRRQNYPPLYWAIWSDEERGSWDMTELLVRKGADVTFKADDDWPYLHYIAETDDREVAGLLFAYGANLNAKGDSGRTALHIALSRGRRDMAEFLASQGSTGPDLHLAACMGNLERVKGFVEGGTDVDATDEAGFTALYWATSIGREEVAEFLISKGADVGAKISSNRPLLHQAAQWGSAKLTKLLISRGADVHARVEDGRTPLHIAAQRGHKNVAELLIAAGADVKAKRASGGTPLHNAAWAGQGDVVEVLLAHGADVSVENKRGETALQLAKIRGHTEVVELLKKRGAKE